MNKILINIFCFIAFNSIVSGMNTINIKQKKIMDYSYSGIQDNEKLNAILTNLYGCNQIELLDFNHNYINDEGLNLIVEKFKDLDFLPSLTVLDLSCNRIEQKGILFLYGLVNNRKGIRYISLYGNSGSDYFTISKFAILMKEEQIRRRVDSIYLPEDGKGIKGFNKIIWVYPTNLAMAYNRGYISKEQANYHKEYFNLQKIQYTDYGNK